MSKCHAGSSSCRGSSPTQEVNFLSSTPNVLLATKAQYAPFMGQDHLYFLPTNYPLISGRLFLEDNPGRLLEECCGRHSLMIVSQINPHLSRKQVQKGGSSFGFRHHRHHGNEEYCMRKALPCPLETERRQKEARAQTDPGVQTKFMLSSPHI